MIKRLILALVIWSTSSFAQDSFFANPEIQRKAPQAFALQGEASKFVLGLDKDTLSTRELLVKALQADSELSIAILNWNQLSMDEQIPYLKRVFEIECKVMGITPPELIIENGITKGSAYFDFDPNHPSPGRVLLNPMELSKEKNPYASLAFLIHETRHSAQFQLAYSSQSIFAQGYKAAFIAQKTLKERFSFCDFLTLLNEYEAFQFGNYVLGKLLAWKLDMPDMGTFASQYDRQGELKIDLAEVVRTHPKNRILEKFNELEKDQKNILGN